MSHFLKAVTAIAAFACSTAAVAQVEFVPPSDSVGAVYSTDSNDGYSGGRGVVFSPTSNYLLDSVALYQDLTNTTLNFTLSLATASTGFVSGGTLLASGSQPTSTSGLEFIDFEFAPILLTTGTYYFLEFNFSGASNQNFFYDQTGAEPYSQPGFTGIDGTSSGYTGNFVLARIQLNPSQSAVPEPSTWAMMLIGFGAVGYGKRRRRRSAIGLPQRA